jgi:hypothetical protein
LFILYVAGIASIFLFFSPFPSTLGRRLFSLRFAAVGASLAPSDAPMACSFLPLIGAFLPLGLAF